MATQITVHPTAKIAFFAVFIAVLIGGSIATIKKFTVSVTPQAESLERTTDRFSAVTTLNDYLLPVVELYVRPDAPESDWSEALAAVLKGRTEVPTEHGRVDVLTSKFAIEVDRLNKWHEAIGQASHYGLATEKQPVVAIIVLPTDSLDKLQLIEDTSRSKGIKLVLLKSK